MKLLIIFMLIFGLATPVYASSSSGGSGSGGISSGGVVASGDLAMVSQDGTYGSITSTNNKYMEYSWYWNKDTETGKESYQLICELRQNEANYVVIVAQYKNSVLTNADVLTYNYDNEDNNSVQYEFTSDDNIDKINLLFWDGMGTLTPLRNSRDFEIQH